MTDRREAILTRLLEVAQGIEGIVTAARNKDEIPEHERPAIVILDAGEVGSEHDPAARPTQAPRRVSMTPEIYILLAGSPANVGSDLNRLRARVLKAVLTDETVRALVLDRKGIRYEGCATGLSRGRAMEGEMGVSISFTYLLDPAQL
jgi:hypothetical protein